MSINLYNQRVSYVRMLKHSINIYRSYPYWNQKRTIFIHIPKSAGTSINHALYGKTLGHYTASEINKKFPKLFRHSFTFSVVRNPWMRVYSAYKFSIQGKTESMGIYKPEQYRIPAFETFESFLFDWLAVKNIEELDYVFQPQYQFVTNENYEISVDFIGRLENIDSDIQYVANKINASIDLPHINSTSNSLDINSIFSTDMKDIVVEIYKKDIELFSYD